MSFKCRTYHSLPILVSLLAAFGVFSHCSNFQTKTSSGGIINTSGKDLRSGSGKVGDIETPEEPNSPPVITLLSLSTVSVVPGNGAFNAVTIIWKVTDPDNEVRHLQYQFEGLSGLTIETAPNANLSQPNYHGSPDDDGAFKAVFRVPAEITNNFTITVHETDPLGQSAAVSINVVIQQDLQKPELTVEHFDSRINCMGGPGNEFYLGEPITVKTTTTDTQTYTENIKRYAKLSKNMDGTETEFWLSNANGYTSGTNPHSLNIPYLNPSAAIITSLHYLYVKTVDGAGNFKDFNIPISVLKEDPNLESNKPSVATWSFYRRDKNQAETLIDSSTTVFPGDRIKLEMTNFRDNCTSPANITRSYKINGKTAGNVCSQSNGNINACLNLIDSSYTTYIPSTGTLSYTLTDRSGLSLPISQPVNFGADTADPVISLKNSNVTADGSLYTGQQFQYTIDGSDDHTALNDLRIESIVFHPDSGADIILPSIDRITSGCPAGSICYKLNPNLFLADATGQFQITHKDLADRSSNTITAPQSGTVTIKRDLIKPVITTFTCTSDGYRLYRTTPGSFTFSWSATDNESGFGAVKTVEISDPATSYSASVPSPFTSWNPGNSSFNRGWFPDTFTLIATITVKDKAGNEQSQSCPLEVKMVGGQQPTISNLFPSSGITTSNGASFPVDFTATDGVTDPGWIRHRVSYYLNGALVPTLGTEWRVPALGAGLPIYRTIPTDAFGQLTIRIEAMSPGGATSMEEVHVRVINPAAERTSSTFIDLDGDEHFGETSLPFNTSCTTPPDFRNTLMLAPPDGILVFGDLIGETVCSSHFVAFSEEYRTINESSPNYSSLRIWVPGGHYDGTGHWIADDMRAPGFDIRTELYPLTHVPFVQNGTMTWKAIQSLQFTVVGGDYYVFVTYQ